MVLLVRVLLMSGRHGIRYGNRNVTQSEVNLGREQGYKQARRERG
jgi:hypothetical protein